MKSQMVHSSNIGVGGIFSAEDAIEKINAEQVWFRYILGFIYEGPA